MKIAVLALPLLILAACDSGPTVKADNAKPSEVAAKVRAAGGGSSFVRPGKWVSTVTIQEMNVPGMPPEFTARMKEQMAQAREYESCLTPEEAKKPKEGFFAGVDKSCKYDHFEMTGGKIDATMRCNREGMSQTMIMAGTYSDERYDMQMSSTMQGAGPRGGMALKMRVDSKRVGECDARAAAKG